MSKTCLLLLLIILKHPFLIADTISVKVGDLYLSGFKGYNLSDSVSLSTINPGFVVNNNNKCSDISVFNKNFLLFIRKKENLILIQKELSIIKNKYLNLRLNNSYSEEKFPLISHSLYISIPWIITPGIILSNNFSTVKKNGNKTLYFIKYSNDLLKSAIIYEEKTSFTTPKNKEVNNLKTIITIVDITYSSLKISLDYLSQVYLTPIKTEQNGKLTYNTNYLTTYLSYNFKELYENNKKSQYKLTVGSITNILNSVLEFKINAEYINSVFYTGLLSAKYNLGNMELGAFLKYQYIHRFTYKPKLSLKWNNDNIKANIELIFSPNQLKKWELNVDIHSLL